MWLIAGLLAIHGYGACGLFRPNTVGPANLLTIAKEYINLQVYFAKRTELFVIQCGVARLPDRCQSGTRGAQHKILEGVRVYIKLLVFFISSLHYQGRTFK